MKPIHPLLTFRHFPDGVVAVGIAGALLVGSQAHAFSKADVQPIGVAEKIATLKDGIAKDPSDTGLREQLAGLLVTQKDDAGAIEQCTAILAMKPDDYVALFNRGVIYSLQGNNAKAIADFTAYTKLKPADPMGWMSLGIFLEKQSDWSGAVAAFGQVISLKPDTMYAYRCRGIDEFNLKIFSAAKADLTSYDSAKPGDSDVNDLLAQIAIATGDSRGAIEHLKAQSAKTPGDSAIWFNLGVAYVGAKEYRNAVRAFSYSNAIKPNPETLFNRAQAYFDLGQAGDATSFAKAATDADAALALKPDYSYAALLKADADYGEGKYDRAAADYRLYLSMPGVSDDTQQDSHNIIMTMTARIKAYPDDSQSYFIRGTAYIAMRAFTFAIHDLKKYTTMEPGDAIGFCNLGYAYSRMKDTPNAAVNFEQASKLKPDYYDAANEAAIAYKTNGDVDQSDSARCVPEYEKAIALFIQAASMTTATPKQQADALYNEAAALESKAKATNSDAPLKTAITVWGKWIDLSTTDPELRKIKQHIADLKARVANDR